MNRENGAPTRRALLRSAGLLAVGAGVGSVLSSRSADAAKPDYRLKISPIDVELAPGHIIKTIGYNGSAPGPLIRAREGQPLTIEVTNKSANAELVHWHGMFVPSAIDGAMEEGTPMIAPGATTSYTFSANPAGSRWYHSHAMAGHDLTQSLYSGQFGFFYVEPKADPGRYDLEVFIAMHHWEPHFVSIQDIRRGPPPDNGLEVMYRSASFNGKALGHGEPIRVRNGQRVLFHLLNASATDDVAVALPGHRFNVMALDGNPVPTPQSLDVLSLAPAERIDAIVEMNNPGVWTFGSTDDVVRAMGMGVVVEYANASGPAQWSAAPNTMTDYTVFGRDTLAAEPDVRFDLLIQKIAGGRGGFNRWTINGKSWPDTDPLIVQRGKRYRLAFHNDSGDMHPMHLHRHVFEITNFAGKTTSGVMKDVVNVPPRKTVDVDFVADDPGLSLLHCHMQLHQDSGFMMLIKYT